MIFQLDTSEVRFVPTVICLMHGIYLVKAVDHCGYMEWRNHTCMMMTPWSSKQPPCKRRKDHKGSAASPAVIEDDHQQCIDNIKRKLHEKHGSMFTPMQYQGWAELLAINSHSSYDSSPPYPMFSAGRSTRNKSHTSEIAAAFTTMAHAFAGNLQPKQLLPPSGTTPSTSTSTAATTSGASPGRIADLRAKYI